MEVWAPLCQCETQRGWSIGWTSSRYDWLLQLARHSKNCWKWDRVDRWLLPHLEQWPEVRCLDWFKICVTVFRIYVYVFFFFPEQNLIRWRQQQQKSTTIMNMKRKGWKRMTLYFCRQSSVTLARPRCEWFIINLQSISGDLLICDKSSLVCPQGLPRSASRTSLPDGR